MSEKIPTQSELVTLDQIHDTCYRCYDENGFQYVLNKAVEAGVDKAIERRVMLSAEETETLRMIVRREAREAERWEKIKSQVLGWGVIAIAGWIGKFILDNLPHFKGQP